MPSSLSLSSSQFTGWFSLLFLVGSTACHGVHEEPELLAVADVAPRQIELGDRIEIFGDGFPEGLSGRVELSGVLHRAGQPAEERYERSFEARSTARNLVSFLPKELELQEIVGVGDEAVHTTFRGELRVVFSSRTRAAGPVYGRLEDVVIDVFPWDVPAEVRERRAQEALRFADFLGLKLHPGSFEVSLIKPKGRAERAGVKAQDRLQALNGVNLLTPSDFVAGGAATFETLALERGRLKSPIVRSIDVSGFRPLGPERLGNAVWLVAFVLGLWFVACGPIERLLALFERRIAAALEEARRPRPHPSLPPRSRWEVLLGRDLLPKGLVGGVLRPLPYLMFLGQSAAFACIALGQSLVSPELDVVCLFLVACLVLACAGSVAGGFGSGQSWSLLKGIKSACMAVVLQVPAGLGLASVFVHSGTLRPDAIVRAQGMAPWRYNLFSSPMLVVACALLLFCAVPHLSRSGFGARSKDVGSLGPPAHPILESLVHLGETTHLLVISGLCALVFLGGFGTLLDVHGNPPSHWALVAGVLLFELKTLCVAAVVLVAKWALGRATASDWFGLGVRWALPLATLSLVLCVLYKRGLEQNAVLRDAEDGLRLLVFLLTLAALGFHAIRIARRVRGDRMKVPVFSMNPWL